MDALTIVFLAVAAVGLVQSGLMLVHAWEHRRFYVRRQAKKIKSVAGPRVTLIAPCKGFDGDLHSNLLALFWQRYLNYQICFVVESESDPALAVIRELARTHPHIVCRTVVAGRARGCGQKVHNLMCAARAVLADYEPTKGDPVPLVAIGARTVRGPAADVLAFVDSDACPHVDWLGRLIARIDSGKHAVATGYRWYAPKTGAFANRLLSAMNNTVIGLTGPHGFNLVWGGAWAIGVEQFRELGLPEAWAGSLSDDLVVSRLVRQAGLRVGFEPHCLVKSPADFDWRKLGEFLRRQFLVVRVYAPTWWKFAFWAGLATNVCLWGTVGVTAYWWATGGPWAVSSAAALAYFLAGVWRAALAARAVRPFVALADDDYDRVAQLAIWGWPLVALANWLAVASSAVGRTIVWRGIVYCMNSPQHTTIIESTTGPREETTAHARTTTRAA